MAHSFVAYIDESGDEGFVFLDPPQRASTEWFVLSAVIAPAALDKTLVGAVRGIRATLRRPPNSTLHFHELEHERRTAYIDILATLGVTVSSVIIDKREIKNPAIFKGKHRLYMYAARLLLERLSWHCRDNRPQNDGGNGSTRLVFEKMKNLSYDELGHYFRILRGQAAMDDFQQMLAHDIRVHWPAIDLNSIEAAPKQRYAGLQLADAVASGLRYALDYSPYMFTEHRYAKHLKTVTYSRRKNYLSYGLKFFPDTPNDSKSPKPRTHWIDKYYK